MISTHCGERIIRLTRSQENHRHKWQCPVCKKIFQQTLRKGAHKAIKREWQKNPTKLNNMASVAIGQWETTALYHKDAGAHDAERYHKGVAHGISLMRQFIFGELENDEIWPIGARRKQ
jgi:hypothetical protein